MVDFMLSTFKVTLQDLGLYGAIRNVQFDLPHSAYHLFSVLEIMYNPYSGTFYTPVGELGFTLHEIFEVSVLSMGVCANC